MVALLTDLKVLDKRLFKTENSDPLIAANVA